MSALIVSVLCPDCHGAGETYFASKNHPGFVASNDCDLCDCSGYVDFGGAVLAHNLAIAAGLCRAFELGRDYQYAIELATDRADERWRRQVEWSSGCGRSAP